MKKSTTLLSLACLSLAFVAFAFVSCDDDDNIDEKQEFTPSGNVEVPAGQLTTVTVSDGTSPYSVFTSDDKISTATVDNSTITITGVEKGTATITVTDKDKKTGKISVTVTDAKGLELDKTTLEVDVNEEDVVTITGGTAPYAALTKDATIATATVAENEITIKGLKAGSTIITATDKDKKNSGTISVTVK